VAGDRVALRLPQLGNGIDEAVIQEWLFGVGEHVEQHEPVVTVETDKATSELEAPVTGTLAVVLAQDGAEVAVGDVLAEFEPTDPA
jgi:pyruvate/2-oxoglutarate dehydrogenase complex dihydrolipoamide acyltransferase (E2) component